MKLTWENYFRVPFFVGYIVRQDIFLASCQRSRVSEELATSVPSACCDGNWRIGVGDVQGGGPGQVKGREVYSWLRPP